MKVGDNVKIDDYIVRKLDDMLETVDGYMFYNPQQFKPQCPICWDILTTEFQHGEGHNPMGDSVKIYKCKKHEDEE